MGVNDYGGTGDALNSPPLGGAGGWADSVAQALNNSDTTVDARVADEIDTHSADTTDVHGIPDTSTGIGTRVTRPNTDDRLVELWNGSAWSSVGYESGERNVAGMVLNGWTVVRSKLMRTDNVVTLTVVNASPTSATADIFMSLPSGFRPLDDGGMLTQVGGWADSPTIVNSRLAANGNVEMRRTGYSGSLQFKWTWVTKDSRPDTLPGTLNTPAPQ